MSLHGTKTYLIIRHAQSANNALPEHQRVSDPSLTPTGKLQSEYLASFLCSTRIDRIYCSAFLRSIETAAVLSQAIKLPAYVHNQIYEVRGCYSGYISDQLAPEPGMGRSAILKLYSNWEIDPSIEDLGWNYNRLVETDEQADQRANSVANWLREYAFDSQQSNSSLTVLIVHADFEIKLLSALRKLFGDSKDRFNEPWIDDSPKNTSITKVTFTRTGTLDIEDYNSVAHLPKDLITR